MENSKVSAEYICNATTRQNRLLSITVGVTYGTPRKQLETLCDDFRTMLRKDSQVLPDTIHVILSNFGASSIDIELRCYVTALGGDDFRQLKSRLNWQIMDIMAQDGCDFAFPSPSVDLETPSPSPAQPAEKEQEGFPSCCPADDFPLRKDTKKRLSFPYTGGRKPLF